MKKTKSELLLIVRDDNGCRYLNPDCAGIVFARHIFEHKNVPHEEVIARCIKIMKAREIIVGESAVHQLREFEVTRLYSRGRKSYKLIIRPALINFSGVLPRLRGFTTFDTEVNFFSNVELPECPAQVA